MNKVTPTFLLSQALDNKIPLDYIGFIRDFLYESDLIVLKFFLTKNQIHKNIQYSLQHMALVTGLTIITLRRSLKRLASFGIIQSWPSSSSNIYVINEFFKQSKVLSRIKRFFIGFMSFLGLSSYRGGGDQLLIKKEYKYIKECAGANTITADDVIAAAGNTMAPGIRLLTSPYKEQPDWGKAFEGETGPPNVPLTEQEAQEIYGATCCLSGSSAGIKHDNTQNLTKVIEACSISPKTSWNKSHDILQKRLLELELDFELSLLQDELLRIRLLGS